MKKSIIILFSLLVSYLSDAQLNGSYTLNPSAAASKTNYKTFASAVSDLDSGVRHDGGTANGKGVSGPVVFNVAADTFKERVIIPKIKGASATSTITFDGGAGNAATRVITYAATLKTAAATFCIANGSYIRLKNLTINASGVTYACSVEILDSLYGSAHKDTVKDITINHCVLNVPNTGTTAYFINLLINGETDITGISVGGTVIGIEVDSSYLNYGYYCVWDYGNSVNADSGHIFKNDTLQSMNTSSGSDVGAEFSYINGLVFQHSSITAANYIPNYYSTGLSIYYCSVSSKPKPININACKIYGPEGFGIYIYSSGNVNPVTGYITNNAIGGGWPSSGAEGIYLFECGNLNIWNNTTDMDSTGGYGLYIVNSGSIVYDIRNNIFSCTTNSKYFVSIPVDEVAITSQAFDYNDFYNKSGGKDSLIIYNGTYYNKNSYQGGGGFNDHSLNMDPGFNSITDLEISNSGLQGDSIPYITTDILGYKRNNPPSMGAYEITIKITSLIDTAYLPSQNITLTFKTYHTFDTGNIFSIQLSDEFGNFKNPITLASVKDTAGTTLGINLPALLSFGNRYRFRVVGSSPAILGFPSSPFSIKASPIIITSPIDTVYLPSQNVKIAFKVSHPFDTSNIFRIQLSDGYGNFSNPVTLATLKDTIGDSVRIQLPAVLSPGCGYAFRITGSNPSVASLPSSSFSIYSLTSPPGDYALKFDGISGWVDLGKWFKQDSFTISFWVNPDSIQESEASLIQIQYDLSFYSNPLVQNNYVLSHGLQQDLLPNQWQYVTITMDGKKIIRKLYIFGQLVDSNQSNYVPQSGYDMRLGNGGYYGPNSSYWKGMVDEVKIYNRILSNTEILGDMNRTFKGFVPGLIAYWDFNDVPCSSTSIDKTTNKRVAILNGGVIRVPSTVPNIGQQVIPNYGGNTNIVNISIYGAGFEQGATVKFSKAGHPDVVADSVTVSADGSLAKARFELKGADTGLYNVVVTDTNHFVITYPNSFTIQPGTKPNVWFQMLGRDYLRSSEFYNLLIEYGNKGNVSARAVPLGFAVTDTNTQVQLMFNLIDTAKNDTALYLKVDTVFGQSFSGRVYYFVIPMIPPGGTGVIGFRIKKSSAFTGKFAVEAWVDSPLYQSPLELEFANCVSSKLAVELDAIGSVFPPVGCIGGLVNNVLTQVADEIFDPQERNDVAKAYADLYVALVRSAIGCIPGKGTTLIKNLIKVLNYENFLVDLSDHDDKCKPFEDQPDDPPPPCNNPPCSGGNGTNPQIMYPNSIGSIDPNYKKGPNYYQNLGRPFPYTIGFENKATATGAAQQVVVIDTLDKSKFDFNTFSFGAIGWGDSVYVPTHAFQKSFSVDYNYRLVDSLIVRVQARLDTGTGVLRWQFISLDTSLQPTQNALAGFLPPNKTSPEGDGFVSYTINAKANLPTGTKINNGATIYFDYNTPIATGSYQNYIDNIKPLSAVNPLTQTNDTTIKLTWSGTDVGSGVAYYNIYIDSNGTWQPFMKYTDSLSGVFHGKVGRTYSFFSLATDSAGNRETDTMPIRTISLTPTSISSAAQGVFELKSIPNPFKQECTIEFNLPERLYVNLTVKDLYGNTVASVANGEFNVGHYEYNFKSNNLPSGIYMIELNTDKGIYYSKMMIEK